jgi:quinol monooxygenase YgiN
MIIILAGTIEVDPDQRGRYIELRLEQMRRYRAMAGTLQYAITPDPVDPSLVNVFEAYASEDAHGEHQAVHQRNLDIPVRRYDLYRYEATRVPLDVS